MVKFDVFLRVNAKLNYDDRHILLQSFSTEEEAEALCQSIRQSFLTCEDLKCGNRTPCYQARESIPFVIIKREED